jgi:hypothetical protein
MEARDEAGLPLQLRILDLASGIAGKPVRYEERLRRGPDTLRFTCAVIADLEIRRVVALESVISAFALEAIYPTAREPMIEGEWRRARENLLAALSDPTSEARKEMSGARK